MSAFQTIIDALERHDCRTRAYGDSSVRSDCPACGSGKSRDKLSITDRGDNVLIHCFACGDTPAILQALGLTSADLFDRPAWQDEQADPRRRRDRNRDAGHLSDARRAAIIGQAYFDVTVVCVAGETIARGGELSDDDMAQLRRAWDSLTRARILLNPHARPVGDGRGYGVVSDMAAARTRRAS